MRVGIIADGAGQEAQDGLYTGQEMPDGVTAPYPGGIGVAAPHRGQYDDAALSPRSSETLDVRIGQAGITPEGAGASTARGLLATSGAFAALGVVAVGLTIYRQPDVTVGLGVVLAAAGLLLLALPRGDSAIVPPICWTLLGVMLLFTGGALPVAARLGGSLVPPVVLALGFLLFGVLWGMVLIVAQQPRPVAGFARGFFSMLLGLLLVAAWPLVGNRGLGLALAAEFFASALTLLVLQRGVTAGGHSAECSLPALEQ